MYIRKTKDEWEIQSCYDGIWSVETTEKTREEARQQAKTYRENGFPVRIVKKRVPIKED